MSGLGLAFLRRGGQAHPTAGSDYIKFADQAVFDILMSKGVSSDGVGITRDDAAKVTSLNYWFKGNVNITTFDELVFFTNLASINGIPEYGEFSSCTALKSITLPDSVSVIGRNAFKGCSSLESINLDNIETISGNAFANCTNLKARFNLPKLKIVESSAFSAAGILECLMPNASRIDAYAFYNSTGLEKADVGFTTAVGDFAFRNCTSLTTLIIRATTPPTYGSLVFFSSTKYSIYVPDEVVSTYQAAAGWKDVAAKIKPLSQLNG